jgi:hypothetical protein
MAGHKFGHSQVNETEQPEAKSLQKNAGPADLNLGPTDYEPSKLVASCWFAVP